MSQGEDSSDDSSDDEGENGTHHLSSAVTTVLAGAPIYPPLPKVDKKPSVVKLAKVLPSNTTKKKPELQKQIATATTAYTTLRKVHDRLHDDATELRKCADAAEKQVVKTHNLYLTASTKLAKAEASATKANNALDKKKKEAKTSSTVQSDLKKECSSLKATIKTMQKQLESLQKGNALVSDQQTRNALLVEKERTRQREIVLEQKQNASYLQAESARLKAEVNLNVFGQKQEMKLAAKEAEQGQKRKRKMSRMSGMSGSGFSLSSMGTTAARMVRNVSLLSFCIRRCQPRISPLSLHSRILLLVAAETSPVFSSKHSRAYLQ